MTVDRPRILCVDDESRVLEGLALHLRRQYIFESTTDPNDALRRLASQASYAVLLSDLRMPRMSGLDLVRQARVLAPSTSRLMLSGDADRESLLSAINEGAVERFLVKPCRPDQLIAAVADAAKSWQSVGAVREREEQTIEALLQLLREVMGRIRPSAAARVKRVQAMASEFARELDVDLFDVRSTVLVSQLGGLVLPPDVSAKIAAGMHLERSERTQIEQAEAFLRPIMNRVNGFDTLRRALNLIEHDRLTLRTAREDVRLLAHVVGMSLDFDLLITTGCSTSLAIDTMRGRRGKYDPTLMGQFAAFRSVGPGATVRELPLIALRTGMVFAQDVYLKTGMKLVQAGQPVTPSFLQRSHNFSNGRIPEPLRMYIEVQDPEAAA